MPPNRYRTGNVATPEEGAKLSFKRRSKSGAWSMYYNPSPEAVKIAKTIHPYLDLPEFPVLMARGSFGEDVLTTYPLNTASTNAGFLQPKYRVRTIVLRGFGFNGMERPNDLLNALAMLPSGFVRDPYFGLGLNYDQRFIIDAIEDLPGVDTIDIWRGRESKHKGPALSKGKYALPFKVFDECRKAVNRIHQHHLSLAAEEKQVASHNSLLTTLDSEKYPPKSLRYRKDAVLAVLKSTLAPNVGISRSDQRAVLSAAKSGIKKAAKSDRRGLFALKDEIEIVTLDDLIDNLKKLLLKGHNESVWQRFFAENPFVLRMAFGFPIMFLGEQVFVGGQKFDGSGGKISDFVAKAAATGNISLIEIKTPDTTLVEAREYRGGIHAPSRDLVGAVNQTLDQRYHLQKSLPLIKDSSGVADVESYAMQCLVIAGRTPTSKPEIKSLELFRNSLKSVTVLTFDELLGKLENLREILSVAAATISDSARAIPAS